MRGTERVTKHAQLSHRQNALLDQTIVRMIVLRGRFKLGQVAPLFCIICDGNGAAIGITHDVKNSNTSRNGAATELFQVMALMDIEANY